MCVDTSDYYVTVNKFISFGLVVSSLTDIVLLNEVQANFFFVDSSRQSIQIIINDFDPMIGCLYLAFHVSRFSITSYISRMYKIT